MRDVELPISFCSFFQLMVFVSENAENKMLFVTQFIFHLMVLFVPAANNGKVTHGKTPRAFYMFSGLLHYSGSKRSLKHHKIGFPRYNIFSSYLGKFSF